jgi:SAM-dependent methyltransferase
MKSEQFDLHGEIEAKHWWFVGRRAIIAQVARTLIPPSKSVTVLDVGCGTGGNISELAGDYRCIGADTSQRAIEIAKSRFPEIEFRCGRVPQDMISVANGADLFLLLDVLEHIEFDKEFLSTLVSGMKPEAHILLTVPAMMSLWSPHDENYGHFRRYEPAGLQEVWQDLPVETKLFSFFNMYLYPLVKGVRLLNRMRNREWGDAGTDLAMPPEFLNQALCRIFSMEASTLTALLRRERSRGFSRGVSLMAVLRKTKNT